MGDLISMAGWYFLPNLVTGWAQSAFYAIWIRAGDPKPQPGSRQWNSHRRRIYIAVVFSYLLYTIYEANHQIIQAGDFYHVLGVPLNVDEKGLNSRFRRLTVLYHPDKVSGTDKLAAEQYYVHLKQARDVLINPVKRFAYDRFGPESLQWQNSKTIYDYVMIGVRNTTMYYAGTSTVLVTLGLIGYLRTASFWRYLAIAAMYTLELYTVTRPESPRLLSKVINPLVLNITKNPPYVQYQMLTLLRKLLISFFIALSQIGPMLFPPSPTDSKDPTPEQMNRLDQVSQASEQEINRLMQLELTPFVGDDSAMRDLRSSMQRWLVDNTVRSNPQVRDAIGRVLQPRNAAPA